MPYSDLYIHASDFDWFIFGDKIKIHAASAGGEVPKVIQNNIKRNRVTYETVKKMPDIFEKSEIKINDSIIRKFYNISFEDVQYIQKVCELFIPTMPKDRDFVYPDMTSKRELFDFYYQNIYCQSFITMARKGFYSFDCVGFQGNFYYQLMAYPGRKEPEIQLPECPINQCSMTIDDFFDNSLDAFPIITLNKIVNNFL